MSLFRQGSKCQEFSPQNEDVVVIPTRVFGGTQLDTCTHDRGGRAGSGEQGQEVRSWKLEIRRQREEGRDDGGKVHREGTKDTKERQEDEKRNAKR